jgi:hypothetical protein
MRRILVLAVSASLVASPAAHAWTWPVEGPVLRSFSLGDNPYAGGQHRGIDVGAAVGTEVRAPAAGTVSFVGSVPNGGRALTIQTEDGYAVTLLQLAAVDVMRGVIITEGAYVGRVGESEDAVTREPHVHLGIRVAADRDGYVDPLTLLPPREAVVPAAPKQEDPVEQPQQPADPVGEAPATPVTAPAPTVEQPGQQPSPEQPQQPSDPVVEQPVVEQPIAAQPVAEQRGTEQPVEQPVEQPGAEQPVADAPATTGTAPIVERPVAPPPARAASTAEAHAATSEPVRPQEPAEQAAAEQLPSERAAPAADEAAVGAGQVRRVIVPVAVPAVAVPAVAATAVGLAPPAGLHAFGLDELPRGVRRSTSVSRSAADAVDPAREDVRSGAAEP